MLLRFTSIGAAVAALLASTGAFAQDTVKIGLVLPLTGGLAPVGKQVQAGVKLYQQRHGTTVAGKKIDVIIKDDGGVPDNSKRLAQELIVNDKVAVVGSALTPSAMAIGPLVDPGQDRQRRDGLRHLGRDQSEEPLHGAHELHARPAVRHHRRMGRQERQQEGGDRAVRLGAGPRGHQGVLGSLHQGRRPDRRHHQGAARQSGLRAVPAARPRPQPGHAVRVRARRPGRHLRQAVHRTRPRQGRHPADRPGRHRRRQRPAGHGRCDARRGDRPASTRPRTTRR